MVEDSNSGVPEAAKEATPRRWPHFALPDGTSTGRPVILIWEHGEWGKGLCQFIDAETRFAIHGGWMHESQTASFVQETGVIVADWPHPDLLAADGWQPASTAPQTAQWVQLGYPPHGWNKPAIVIAHWACDMSGEEQPPFRGWFQANVGDNGRVHGFHQAPKGFVAWRPLWPGESLPSMRAMMEVMAAARADERRACLKHVTDVAQAERDRLARYVVKANGDHHRHAAVALDGVAHAINTRGLRQHHTPPSSASSTSDTTAPSATP